MENLVIVTVREMNVVNIGWISGFKQKVVLFLREEVIRTLTG